MVIFNKADEDEDDQESVTAFYAEAYAQAKCEFLPKAEDLNESNVKLLAKKKMGPKTKPMEECVEQATALHAYIGEELIPFVVEKLKKTQPVEAKTTTFEDMVKRTEDEILK